jgi:putative oxidoreductase
MTTSQPSSTAHNRTAVDLSLLIARLAAGLVMLPHGTQHLFGWFGGAGLSSFVQYLGPLAYLVSIGEVFGSLALILGVMSRFSAASLMVIMLGAIFIGHVHHGFFMNWYGTKQGEGFEYHLLMIALLLVVSIAGPGRFSASVPGMRSRYLE